LKAPGQNGHASVEELVQLVQTLLAGLEPSFASHAQKAQKVLAGLLPKIQSWRLEHRVLEEPEAQTLPTEAQARETITRLQPNTPGWPDATYYKDLCQAHARLGELKLAWERARELDPENEVQVLLDLFEVMEGTGDPSAFEALADHISDRAKTMDAFFAVHYLTRLGLRLIERGFGQRAGLTFDRTMEIAAEQPRGAETSKATLFEMIFDAAREGGDYPRAFKLRTKLGTTTRNPAIRSLGAPLGRQHDIAGVVKLVKAIKIPVDQMYCGLDALRAYPNFQGVKHKLLHNECVMALAPLIQGGLPGLRVLWFAPAPEGGRIFIARPRPGILGIYSPGKRGGTWREGTGDEVKSWTPEAYREQIEQVFRETL
jgi:hypothetical protein